MTELVKGLPSQELLGEVVLFKGLDPKGFRYYFEQGGIRPNRRTLESGRGWITTKAREAFHNTLKHTDLDNICIAIIKGNRYLREPAPILVPDKSSALIWPSHYKGDVTIPFSDVIEILTTDLGLEEIHYCYELCSQPKIGWDEFSNMLVVIDKEHFRKKLKDEEGRYKRLSNLPIVGKLRALRKLVKRKKD